MPYGSKNFRTAVSWKGKHHEIPPRVEYRLTTKGQELVESVISLLEWMRKWSKRLNNNKNNDIASSRQQKEYLSNDGYGRNAKNYRGRYLLESLTILSLMILQGFERSKFLAALVTGC